MASGPEHYRIAADMIEMDEDDLGGLKIGELIAVAQVHATLALVAATLAATHADAVPAGTHEDWWTVMGGVG